VKLLRRHNLNGRQLHSDEWIDFSAQGLKTPEEELAKLHSYPALKALDRGPSFLKNCPRVAHQISEGAHKKL
jgi:hypothetical protein